MTLGFKRQFGLYVWEGSKTHTIRADCSRHFIPGSSMCNCFIDTRQKSMARLGDWGCVNVEPIQIDLQFRRVDLADHISGLSIRIAGIELSPDEIGAFAWRDGFRPQLKSYAWMAMAQFWRDHHGTGPFTGSLIHWQWTQEGQAPRPKQLPYVPMVETHSPACEYTQAVNAPNSLRP